MQSYCRTSVRLCKAMKSKYPGPFTKKDTLLHDYAQTHTTYTTQDILNMWKWKEGTGQPSIQSPLIPHNFHTFGPLKKALRGQQFHADKGVNDMVKTFFQKQPPYIYKNVINLLVTH
jgi:hypothetical protein